MTERMDIYSIKVSLHKCGIDSSAGFTNIFGRNTLPKSIIFPKAKIKYRSPGEIKPNGISETYDLKDACLTENNWAGACCGSSYFIICNTSSYSIYDKNGIFIKRLYVKEVGELVSARALFFVTRTSDGIERLWSCKGDLKEENKLSAEQMLKLKKCKILRKGEYIG